MLVLCVVSMPGAWGLSPCFGVQGCLVLGAARGGWWLVLSRIHPLLCPGCAVRGDGELTLTTPEFPHTIKPVPASPWGRRLWLGTDGLRCSAVLSAFCISGYKSPCTKPAKKSNSQQCKREGSIESLFCSSQQFSVPGGAGGLS